MSHLGEAMISVLTLVVALAFLSVLVSGRAKTVDVINSLSAGFANSLSAATAPVNQTGVSPVVSTGGGFGNLPSLGFNNLLPN